MQQGWVKLYRKVEDNDFLMTDNTAFIIFMKLMLFADSRTGSYRTGQRALAERCNLNYSTVYKALVRLEEHGIIKIDSNLKYSKIYIQNWTVYQSNKEIDTILEHNYEQMSKQSSKRTLTDEKSVTVSAPVRTNEAHGKRTVSAREDYNKNKEDRIKTKELVSTVVDTGDREEISRLYYKAIKALGLPNMNNKTIKNKITAMAAEGEYREVVWYLNFLQTDYRRWQHEFKPQILEAMDIYRKRVAVMEKLREQATTTKKTRGFSLI